MLRITKGEFVHFRELRNKVKDRIKVIKELCDKLKDYDDEHSVEDGVFDVTGLETLDFPEDWIEGAFPISELWQSTRFIEKLEELETFLKKYPNPYCGFPYMTYTVFFFSGKPKKICNEKGMRTGAGRFVDIPEGVKRIVLLASGD